MTFHNYQTTNNNNNNNNPPPIPPNNPPQQQPPQPPPLPTTNYLSSVDWRGRPFFSTELHRTIGDDISPLEDPTTPPSTTNDDPGDDDHHWSRIIHRATTHPDEIGRQGAYYGQTALHLACYKHPPLRAIRTLVEQCPGVGLVRNVDGEVALHVGIEGGASEEVLMYLIRSEPRCVGVGDEEGDTPLHVACRSGSAVMVIREMLDVDPTLAKRGNKRGVIPGRLYPRGYVRAKGRGEVLEMWGEAWEAMRCLSVAVAGDGGGNEIHAALRAGGPRAFVFAAARFFPERLVERDEEGNVPLHLAAGGSEVVEDVDEGEDDEWEEEEAEEWDPQSTTSPSSIGNGDSNIRQQQQHPPSSQSTPLPQAITSKQITTIDFLLHENPFAASIPNKRGRLPLSLAIESHKGWEDGLRSLVTASPRSLYTRDTVTRMLPFMMAAVGDTTTLTTVYELIRVLPESIHWGLMVRGGGGGGKRDSSSLAAVSSGQMTSNTNGGHDDDAVTTTECDGGRELKKQRQ